MPREILPHSVLQRNLQAISSQRANILDIATSAIHCKPRKRRFSQLDNDSEEDVDTFKGRLLGVEDSLILAVLFKPQEASPLQVYGDGDKEIDGFKGRLLGVEDGLIDAIVSESCPNYLSDQRILGSPDSFSWYSQAEVGMPESKSLRSRKASNDEFALSAQQDSRTSAGSLDFSETQTSNSSSS
jgi:hypothetical protein